MKSPIKFSLILTLVLSAITIKCEAQTLSDGDWQVLFNGEDLSGWRMLSGQHKADVKDGIIVGTHVAGEPNGFLCTTEEFDDFILELEIKTDLLLDNSGIQFRSFYHDGEVHGYQAQIQNRPPHVSQWSGAIVEEPVAWVYIFEDDPVRQKAYIQNQWNQYRIEAIGTTNRVWVNNVPTAHLVDDNFTNGFICMQYHGNSHEGEKVYMRNVRIQTEDLQPSPFDDILVVNNLPNTISGQEESQGFELLFDGETINGWEDISQPGMLETAWEINDGELTISAEGKVSGDNSGVLMTEEQYGPFELKFDFRLHSDEAIVGVEYYFDEEPKHSRQSAIYGRRANRRGVWKEDLMFGESDDDTHLFWNQAVIRASPDNKVEYWLNGCKLLEYKRDSDQPVKGHIMLDAYNEDIISYRSI